MDGITGLGTTHFDVDGWGIDVLIGGSQKAVMIPPGLSYLSVSQRAWEAMETSRNPRYYFDLRKERKNAKNGESAYTPAVALIAALGAAFDWIAAQGGGDLEKGRIQLVGECGDCAAMTRAALEALGLKLFAPSAPSAAATAVLSPEGVDSGVFVKELKSRFAAVITNGQGEMKGQIFRIAHLGFFDYMDTIALVGALEQVAQITQAAGIRIREGSHCGAEGVRHATGIRSAEPPRSCRQREIDYGCPGRNSIPGTASPYSKIVVTRKPGRQMKIVLAEKVSPATVDVFAAENGWQVVHSRSD